MEGHFLFPQRYSVEVFHKQRTESEGCLRHRKPDGLRKIYKEVTESMAKVEAKQPIVQEISDLLKDAQSAVLVDYQGITVDADTQLRKQLREANVTYRVYKNTLMNIAMKGTAFEAMAKDLKGPSAIAVSSEDATAPARVIATFAKTNDKVSLKAGVVEGTYYDEAGIKAVALIPGKNELLSKLLGSLQSPMANFARVIDQIAKAKGGEGAAPAEAEA